MTAAQFRHSQAMLLLLHAVVLTTLHVSTASSPSICSTTSTAPAPPTASPIVL